MMCSLRSGIARKRIPRPWAVAKAVVLIVAACLFSGCIEDTMLISVKPDGSGTIEETVLIGNAFFEMMQDMGKNMNEEGKDKDNAGQAPAGDSAKKDTAVVADMIEKAKKNAGDFGETVRFVSAKPAKTASASGYTAVYAFEDISKVMLNQNPGKKTPGEGKSKDKGAGSKDAAKNDTIKFAFTKGTPTRLAVHMPPPKPADKDEKAGQKPQGADDPNALEMMKVIFKDMKVSIVLNVEGDIVNTNATYRSGRKVTLIDMDFGKLINDLELLKKINKEQPESLEEIKKMVKGIDGLKLEFTNPVIIDFK